MYKNCDEHPDIAKILRYGDADGLTTARLTCRGYSEKVQNFWDEDVTYISAEELCEFYQEKGGKKK
ncbi:MAG: hypothetical protein GX025_03530 [Clostridiales bacterium]|nr:hypothetical protein [Clostridiales bacterium]